MKKESLRFGAGLLALCLMLGAAGCKQKPEDKELDEPVSSSPQPSQNVPDEDTAGGIYSAGYWLEKLNSSGASSPDYEGYNASLAADPDTKCVDLAAMGDSIAGSELRAMLEEAALPSDTRYTDGGKASEEDYARISANIGLENVPERGEVGYGFIVKNTLMRTFPTAQPSYEMDSDLEFDLFNETRLNVFEPVRILHPSADGEWLFVQAWNYRGWVDAEAVAETDSSEWARYADAGEVLVVTGNRVTLNENVYNETASGLELFMGTTLPLLSSVPETIDFMSTESGYAVLLPARDSNGRFHTVQALVPWNADVHEGVLPYSQAALLRQAFKLAGDRHGWSGMNKSRDSTALVDDVFRTFGFKLPRNSSQQAVMPAAQTVDLSGMSDAEKLAAILDQPAGSLIIMNGHVALYVGSEGGMPYVLHSLYTAYDSGGREIIYNAVVVTDLSLVDWDGNTYLSNVTAVKTIA